MTQPLQNPSDQEVRLSPELAAALGRALANVAESENQNVRAGLAELYNEHTDDNYLVDIHGLGAAVFGKSAPSLRTLRTLTRQGVLPHFRIGKKLIRYDLRLVRAALELKCLVHAKKARGAQ